MNNKELTKELYLLKDGMIIIMRELTRVQKAVIDINNLIIKAVKKIF